MTKLSVTDYVNTKRTKNTKSVVRGSLTQFFRHVSKQQLLTKDLDTYSLQYLENSSIDQIFADANSYFDSIYSLSPKTISLRIGFLIHYLKMNDIAFSAAQDSILSGRLPRSVTVHDEDYLTTERLRSVLAQSDVMMRAIILVLASSGMRIGEVLSFDISQMHGNEIHMRASQMKGQKPHVYFISVEAVQAVNEWLKVRDVFATRALLKTKKCLGHSSVISSCVFPYSYSSIGVKFTLVMQKAGLYERDMVTRRGRITLHSIRKWTDSTMKIHISSNLANALIGHFEAGDSSYRRYTREQLREAYAKVEPYLTILAPQEYADLKSETQQQLASHDKLLVGLMEENYQIKADNKVIKDTLNSLVRLLDTEK
ncbi:tyrosine-type recombinase/integrase [Methanorbis furvi]|uniref:Tyrosine recombinase XerC n=1 Tax=Methanorbis furvi TaxID=3028299 RepID=A0AAE4MB84_9EURY|nr:Tyrosine recombinase XerC [Methanocorpusculaceae archaeon Ag1]